jgi:uncharacterized protein (DUF697 family)
MSASGPKSSAVVTSAPPPSGRLAVLTAYAALANAIPIPFLPDQVVVRIRGAVVYDVAARHGLSLTSDARRLLAEPGTERQNRLVRAAEGLARQILRRVGPLGALSTATRAAEVYALGFLLERYFTQTRATAAARIHLEEARRVRDAIDRAVLRAFSPSLRPSETTLGAGGEDLRDEFTRWIDAVLLTSAALPSYLERRLESAFDQVVAEMPELKDV